MSRPNVVCVLGTGASAAYGFPSGLQLLERITRGSLEADTTLHCSEYRAFQTALEGTSDDTVDAFLESQPSFEAIGRKAIAEWLIRCEEVESLRKNPNRRGWVRRLLQIRLPPKPLDPNVGVGLSFVTFNYDRSLEMLLFICMQSKYQTSTEDTAALCKAIPITHVYGSLGALPWEIQTERRTRAYTRNVTPETVEIAADQIKVIHQEMDVQKQFDSAWVKFMNAERIYFLGFGYHQANLERLRIDLDSIDSLQVAGTSMNVSERRRRELTRDFPRLALIHPSIDIFEFLSEHADI
jgi:hypothetical protein